MKIWRLFVFLALSFASLADASFAAERIRLQLKWYPQAQFAGYFAAQAKGYYAQEKVDVSFLPGGATPDGKPIIPEQVVDSGQAELGIDWLSALLSAREEGKKLTNIAQVFQYSGMREVAFKKSGIKSAADLRGHRVAVWMAGNEDALLATLEKLHINPQTDLTLLPESFTDGHFAIFDGTADAVAVMTYNEYRQVLDRGAKPEDLTIIDFNQEGTALLEDGIIAREGWLAVPANKDVAARFLRASLRGWEYCRDHAEECVDLVMRENPTSDREHQSWMMTEVNKLIWGPPTPQTALGFMDPVAFGRTASIALQYGVIHRAPDRAAFTHEIWGLSQRGGTRR